MSISRQPRAVARGIRKFCADAGCRKIFEADVSERLGLCVAISECIKPELKYAVKLGLIPVSIMGKEDRPSPERFVSKLLKQSEAIALFEAVKGHRLDLSVIIAASYGLRRSEVVGLR